MYNTKILFAVAALSGTSLSQKSDSQFCSADAQSLVSLFAQAATIPPSLSSYLAPNPGTPTGSATITTSAAQTPDFIGHAQFLCQVITELPSSLLPDFQTYAYDLLSFGSAHSSVYEAYITNCVPEPEAASMTNYLNYVFTATGDLCQSTPTPTGAPNGTYPTSHYPTATGSYVSYQNSTTAVVTAAAARPTGALLGAAAMGGVLGAAVML
ncbi:hypothetical protein FHL15_010298 [Xylaria flabelliformis]|uniref:Infection structure specific protein n=1 Tax=Xylaria flabelliformis TaxID=2512241 RepID=A0A553HLL1_9PEZI|nr:hypothetical protein FHL15_010298 [Xylaria flabelliformis]